MQHQQVNGRQQELDGLVQQLAIYWRNDWNNADYPGKILPDLIRNPGKGTKKEREILGRILKIVTPDERRQLPQKLKEAYALICQESTLRSTLERMIKKFHLREAEEFFQKHSTILDSGAYETIRKDRIERRQQSILEDMKSYRFKDAKQLMKESCEVLLDEESKRMQAWFQEAVQQAAMEYLRMHIVPLLEQGDVETARARFEKNRNFVDAHEYSRLEATYSSRDRYDPFLNSLQKVKSPLAGSDSGDALRRDKMTQEEVRHQEHGRSSMSTYPGSANRSSWKKYYLPEGESPESIRMKRMRREVGKRGIIHLVHFTQASNVESILKHGLLPRNTLKKRGIPFVANDELRLDNMCYATSLSISFPNYKMFYKYRRQDESKRWVVLLLDPSVLWEYRCYFCRTNAASLKMRDRELFKRRDVSEFVTLFDVLDGKPPRHVTQFPEYYTTDPQAEVLVADNITPAKIQVVTTADTETLNYLSSMLPSAVHCAVRKELFEPRQDYKYWNTRWCNGY